MRKADLTKRNAVSGKRKKKKADLSYQIRTGLELLVFSYFPFRPFCLAEHLKSLGIPCLEVR